MVLEHKKKKVTPEKVWMACINLNGLLSTQPIRGTLDPNYVKLHLGKPYWYNTSGNLSVDKLGLVIKEHIVQFASVDKKEVQLFIDGARGMTHLMVNLGHTE